MITCLSKTPSQKPLKSALVFIVLCAAIFLLRSFNTHHIEIYDAFYKWEYANQILVGRSKIPDQSFLAHHYMRWGVTGPMAILIWLFGNSLSVYFSGSMLCFAIFMVAFLTKAKKNLALPFLMLLAVFIYTEPMVVRASQQLHTRIFGALYIFLAVICLESKKSRWHILFAAIWVFFAYGAKETYGLFFAPAIGIYLLLRKDKYDIGIFIGVTAALFVTETLIINQLVEGISWGRLQVLMQGQHATDMMHELRRFTLETNILNPWRQLSPLHQMFACVSIGYALCTLAIPRIRRQHSEYQLLIHAIILSYMICSVSTYISLDPLVPLQPAKSSYYTIILPFMMYSTVLLWQYLCTYVKNYKRLMHITTACAACTIAVMFAMRMTIYPLPKTNIRPFMNIHYDTAYWDMDAKLKDLMGYIEDDYVLVRTFEQPWQKMRSMARTLKMTDAKFYDKERYVTSHLDNALIFSKKSQAILPLKKCIYLTTHHRVLRIPTLDDVKPCPESENITINQ